PSCELDDACEEYDKVENKFLCKGKAWFWSKTIGNTAWGELKGGRITELACVAGNIVIDNWIVPQDYQFSCRQSRTKLQPERKGAIRLPYFIGTFLLLNILVVIITTILLQVTGEGWLHTVIIEAIRARRKKKKQRKDSVQGSNLSSSVLSPNAQSTSTKSSLKRTSRKGGYGTPPTQSNIDRGSEKS
ncbi:hypothetical protein PENTCL1PPCAC_1411, partial [Pristionchus entomophagus]